MHKNKKEPRSKFSIPVLMYLFSYVFFKHNVSFNVMEKPSVNVEFTI